MPLQDRDYMRRPEASVTSGAQRRQRTSATPGAIWFVVGVVVLASGGVAVGVTLVVMAALFLLNAALEQREWKPDRPSGATATRESGRDAERGS